MLNNLFKYTYGTLHILSTFILPILIVLVGLKGNISLVADITILQSILFMFFFPLNGNARNYLLNSVDKNLVKNILNLKSLIFVPLFFITYISASFVLEINSTSLLLLILVGSVSWFLEIFITEAEKNKKYKVIILLILLNIIGIIYLIFTELTFKNLNYFCIYFILFNSPIIISKFYQNLFNINFKNLKNVFLTKILNQIGGTTIIGLSSFILKYSLLLILPKTIAGTLFLSFTIGASLCTAITYSLMPSVIFNNLIQMKKSMIIFFLLFCLAGIIVIFIKILQIEIIDFNQDLFLISLLFSLAGSFINIFSQYYKFSVSSIITDLNLSLYEIIINGCTIVIVILLIIFINEYGAVLTYILSGLISLYFTKLFIELQKE